ncbi:MAG: histidinol dehydrogenase [Candidatus Aminicenantes bacterium RBG_16_63_16]|nr:MAG: histidinol dehydrogenase [Candidatus Aminicenantes bacterium RBG_16_63_16]
MNRRGTEARRTEVCTRRQTIDARAARIIEDVRAHGDDALRKYTLRFDGVRLGPLRTEEKEWEEGLSRVSREFTGDLESAVKLLRRFARRQLRAYRDFECEVERGVYAGQRISPVRRVGIYVPGGRYPLFSSLLMAAVPARVAGVEEITVCTPPTKTGTVPDSVLAAARLAGVLDIFKVGGAQAIAAMAFGTATIPRVDKIVGPGNIFVNAAKRAVYGKVGVDFIAGPTEILIIAEDGANAEFIAADLIAQAEHDPQPVGCLVTDSAGLAKRVIREVRKRLGHALTAEAARRLLANPELTLRVKSMREAVEVANAAAPEHLSLCVKDPDKLVAGLNAFGSLAVGYLTSPVLEDYASGLNHILPTNAAARYTGGLGVRDFLKVQTTLRVSEEGLGIIGPLARRLATAEGLPGHADAVVRRLRASRID